MLAVTTSVMQHLLSIEKLKIIDDSVRKQKK